MQWTRIQIRNFLSIKEATIDLDNRGLVLIEGRNLTNQAFRSNGSGKSTIVNSIVYALYDITLSGLKADAVVNNVAKKNTSVILEGTDGENTYRIERYRKHSKHKNLVKLFLNDKEITEKSTRDTNARIEQLIGVDYTTFTNSVVFSQGNGAGRFSTATDKEKKEILENLVNLSIYVKAQDIAKDRVKEKQAEIDENIRQGERLQWELDNIDSLEKQDKENYEQTRKMIKQEMDNIKSKTDELEKYVHFHATAIQKDRDLLASLEKKAEKGVDINIDSEHNQVQAVYKELRDKQYEHNIFVTEKENLVSQYKKLQSNTHCPMCGNELDDTHRKAEMETIKEQLRPILVNIQNSQTEVETLNDQYKEVYEDYVTKKESHEAVHVKFKQLLETIQKRKETIHNYERSVQQKKESIQSSQYTLDRLQQAPKPRSRDGDRRGLQEKIKASKGALVTLEADKRKLEDVVKIYSNSGVKSHVLDLITPFLNEKANTYLSKLTGSDIEITFSTQTRNKNGELADKFDIQVHNGTGGSTYQSNSEGEKKRIDLAISLAIQDLLLTRAHTPPNVIIYDEVFDALDGVGSENTVALLRERLDVVGTIFVITHSDHLKNLFEEIITVTKTGQGESIVTEGENTT